MHMWALKMKSRNKSGHDDGFHSAPIVKCKYIVFDQV